ncbi:hypothetical protein ACQKFK_22230 [Bacillus mycoides]|uniref:hypothetical protein n=1 Tax=Bacillus mycoides TaxID=1405 RepID=UPI003CFCE2AE
MKKLISAEIQRIFARKSTIVLFLISILYPLIFFYLSQLRWKFDSYVVNGIKLPLNNLNFPVGQILTYHILLIIIILPLFYSESLSSEVDSGAYKMILLRPFKKWKTLVSKWISLIIVYAGMLLLTYLTNTLIGYIFMPKVEQANYYNIEEPMGLFASSIYNLKFYFIIFIVHIALLSVVSFISVILKKPLLTFMGSIAFIVASIYLFDSIKNILFHTPDIVFSILGGTYNFDYTFVIFILIMPLFFGTSLFIWNKRIGSMV